MYYSFNSDMNDMQHSTTYFSTLFSSGSAGFEGSAEAAAASASAADRSGEALACGADDCSDFPGWLSSCALCIYSIQNNGHVEANYWIIWHYDSNLLHYVV